MQHWGIYGLLRRMLWAAESLETIGRFSCGALQSLNALGCRLLTQTTVGSILESSLKLEELRCGGCDQIERLDMPHSSLLHLEVPGCSSLRRCIDKPFLPSVSVWDSNLVLFHFVIHQCGTTATLVNMSTDYLRIMDPSAIIWKSVRECHLESPTLWIKLAFILVGRGLQECSLWYLFIDEDYLSFHDTFECNLCSSITFTGF